MFSLVDCNNFYASCQRVFEPKLEGKPVVVLSNCDGCVIARSNEAKALGIKMGEPFFKVKQLVKAHQVAVFSSNYALYGDMSSRVMDILKEYAPKVAVYSVDEAFLSLAGMNYHNLTTWAVELKETVRRCVGIPVSIGIAPTKTLAKAANYVAKKNPVFGGVFDMSEERLQQQMLALMPVEEVWGVGRQYARWLQQHGITTALQLRDMEIRAVRQKMTVVGERMVRELRGESCLPLEEVPAEHKTIACTRSFNSLQTSFVQLREAVSCYTARAAEKMRTKQLYCARMQVFIRTNGFSSSEKQYSNACQISIPFPSQNTGELIAYAIKALEKIYRPGYSYKKAGVIFTELRTKAQLQPELFHQPDITSETLMATIDQLNQRYGRNMVRFASMGYQQSWKMQQAYKSPSYTTNWKELLVVSA